MSELDKLEKYLQENHITYQRIDKAGHFDTHQIVVYKDGERLWDAVCHRGSFGYKEGLLEVMGEPVVKPTDGDRVAGWLTADDVIARWTEYRQNGRRWI